MNKLKLKIVGIVAFFSCTIGLYAQNAEVIKFSCDQAITYGLTNNTKLKIQNKITSSSELDIKDTKNDRLPKVTYHTGYHILTNLNQYENGFLHAPTTYHTPRMKYNFTLDAEIPIYEGGIIKNEIIKKEAEARVAKWRERKDQKDFKLQLHSAYLQVLHVEEQQKLLLTKISEDSLVINQTEALRKNGIVTQNEVLRTQLQLSNHKMTLTQWNNEKEILQHEIKTILALPESITFEVNTDGLLRDNSSIETASNIHDVLEKNETFQIAHEELIISNQNKRLIKANALPKISGGLEYGLNYPNFMFFPPEEHLYSIGMVGFNFIMPLDNLLKNKVKIKKANIAIEKASLEIEETEEQLHHELFRAKTKLKEADDQIEIAQQAIKQAEENYRIVKMKYLNHLSLITELIDADNVLLETQSQEISLKINKQIKYYQLQYILGNL